MINYFNNQYKITVREFQLLISSENLFHYLCKDLNYFPIRPRGQNYLVAFLEFSILSELAFSLRIIRYIFLYLAIIIRSLIDCEWPATYQPRLTRKLIGWTPNMHAEVLLLGNTMNHCESLSHQLRREKSIEGKTPDDEREDDRPCKRMTSERMIGRAARHRLARGRRKRLRRYKSALHVWYPLRYRKKKKQNRTR